jgi:hypothetical protein
MSFSVEQALRIATANLAQRAKTRTNAYTLYFSNDGKRYEGQFDGLTIKSLIDEFRRDGRNYKFAFITKKGDDSLLRFYNSTISKKFFSMTRKPRVKK